jgi:hypothetical protein
MEKTEEEGARRVPRRQGGSPLAWGRRYEGTEKFCLDHQSALGWAGESALAWGTHTASFLEALPLQADVIMQSVALDRNRTSLPGHKPTEGASKVGALETRGPLSPPKADASSFQRHLYPPFPGLVT